MKSKILLAGILFLTISAFSQTQYEVSDDPQHHGVKILKGIINKDVIKNDSSFKWYAENQKIYQNPDPA